MRVAVVTGASSGVGLAVSQRLIARGWSVVGLARGREPLEASQRTLGERFSFDVVDVSSAAHVRDVFERIGAKHPTIDLLVNNAAVFKMKRFEDWSESEIDALIDTNLKGTIYCTRAALRWLARGSRIVNIGSVAGTHGIPDQAVYCASKYGVDGFSEALGQELRPRGILMTVIAPGGIDTPLWAPGTNPYPGEPGQLLNGADVASLVEYVAELPSHVVLKKLVVFPTNEWH